ncbi:MAG TPA: phosphate/phosphite/phosphonate ABC transporter substrate-binding protein [Polyangia bacterium]|jgi:phosphonate transport system substrate-binding protein
MLMRWAVPLAAASVLLAACQRPAGSVAVARPRYRIGYMICNSEEETLRRFRPLTAYLGRELGAELEAVAIDTVDYPKRARELDFTHTNSLLYVLLHRLHGVEIVAAERAGALGARAQGAIIARADSGLRTLGDLKGKRMMFGPALGPLSYMSQLDLLQRAGIDPDGDLALYSIPPGSFKHEKVIYAVLFGRADAGAVPVGDLDRMAAEGRIERGDFTVLATAEPILYCNVGRGQTVDDALAARVQRALLALDRTTTVAVDGEVVKVLERAAVDGYEVVRDADFDPVRRMAQRTGMPPYEKL